MLDALYHRCVKQLPPDLAGAAVRLPELLGLAPRGVGWGDVFKHDVTLAAPSYFEDALDASLELVDSAIGAHMLAVIEAFAYDRIADGQIETTAPLERLLVELRLLRDELAYQVDPGAPLSFRAADRESHAAIVAERGILAAREAVDRDGYVARSLGKQAVGFPATLALFASQADFSGQALAEQALRGVWLGLQFRDDAIDWEDDWARGGAWAVCLAQELAPAPLPPRDALDEVRGRVLASRALELMLELSRAHFALAAAAAGELRAMRLARWAREQAHELEEVLEVERLHPGYVVRAHRLRFAMEMLSA